MKRLILRRVPVALQVVLALGLGALMGLFVTAPQLAMLGGPGERLTDWLIPLVSLSLLMLISLRSPLAGLTLTVLLEPYSHFLYLDIDVGAGVPALSLVRVVLAFLLVLLLVQAALGRRRLHPPAWPEAAGLLFVVSLVLAVSRSRFGLSFSLQSILDAYFLPLMAFYLARQIVGTLPDLRRYAWVMALAGVLLALLVVREQLTGEVLFNLRETGRYNADVRLVVSLMGNPAPMGVSTALTLPFGFVLLLYYYDQAPTADRARSMARAALPAALIFIAAGVFMTYNRASWLVAVLAGVLFMVFTPRLRRWALPVLLVSALVLLLSWSSLSNSATVNERVLNEKSIGYRAEVAQLALDMVSSNPLFGRGYYNFGPIAREQYGWDPVPLFGIYPPAHNSFMFILVSGGLLALLPYGLWFALLGWEGLRRARSYADQGHRVALIAGAALLLGYVLASVTFDNVDAISMNLIFAAGIGAVWGATQRSPIAEGLPSSAG